MGRFIVALAIVTAISMGLGQRAMADEQGAGPACATEQVLVKVNPGVDPADVVARHGGTILWTIEGIGVQVVAVPAGTQGQKIDEFMADPDVKYAEPNGVVRATQGSDRQECPSSAP